MKLTGLATVHNGPDGEPLSVTIDPGRGLSYHVVLDDVGAELARRMAGRRVVLAGHALYEDGDAILTVTRFREARKEPSTDDPLDAEDARS